MILNDISLGFNGRAIIKNLSGSFAQGSMTAIIGANGAGKSTLLQGLAGLLPPLSGSLTKASKINYLPQSPALYDDLPITLYDFVAMSFHVKLKFFEKLSDSQTQKITSALKQMKLHELSGRLFSQLSGGQKQRALFARAMLDDAALILLDEPFSALDFMTIETCLQHLKRRADKGDTIIAVLHDYELVRRYFKSTLILGGNLIAWGETKQVLTPDNLHKAHHIKESANV